MPLVLDGTNGVSGVDGTASNPAIEGTDSNTGIFYPAADTVAIGTGGTEALRVNSSQQVGIGTSTPGVNLQVEGAGASSIRATFKNTNSGTGECLITFADKDSTNNNHVRIGSTGNNLVFYAGNTEQARTTAAGLFQFNSGYGSVATAFGCRAWVNFNGTGTVAIRGSGNVSSITDGGVGVYTINFTNAMPDGNYTIVATNRQRGGVTLDTTVSTGNTNTTGVEVYSLSAGSTYDSDQICAAAFR